MVEQKTGKQNGIDRRPWDSRISPKTPHSVLSESTSVNLSSAVAADIIKNVIELTPGTKWDKILADYSFCDKRGVFRGKGKTAIERGVAHNFRLVAIEMGWGMDSTQIVCLSGLFFRMVIDKNTAEKSRRLKELTDPERKIASEETRAKAVEKMNEKIVELAVAKSDLQNSLVNFTRKKLTRSERDLEQFEKALGFLVSGKIEEVAEVFLMIPKRKLEGKKEPRPVELPPIPQERAIVLFQAQPQPQAS